MRAVREELLVGERAPDPRADPHRREALRVQRVRPSLHHQGQPEGESPPPGFSREDGAGWRQRLWRCWTVCPREAWDRRVTARD